MTGAGSPWAPYLADFETVTARRPTSFFCPILLEEAPGVKVIKGHVLPESVRIASRASVPQREDVDHFSDTQLKRN
jgi:hypothetical protein